MGRLIVNSEAVPVWGVGNEVIEKAVIVSVTGENGEPARNLGAAEIKIHFMPPRISGLQFEGVQVTNSVEQLPGVYLIQVGAAVGASPDLLGMPGKHVISVAVSHKHGKGQTLTTLVN